MDAPKTNYHLQPENPLEQKLAYEPKVHRAAAYLHYHKRGVAQSIIHHLKYKGIQELGPEVGRWYGAELLKSDWDPDMIVPVPLHRSKLRRRGYNQSDLIAEGLSEVLDKPYHTDLVIRHRKTKTQTRKSKVERLQNVSSIYQLIKPEAFDQKKVLLVDDVITTGATIGELASLIASQTAVDSIYVATIAAGK